MYYDEMGRTPMYEDIGDFHEKFGLPTVTTDGAYPRHPDMEMVRFRLNFLLEELIEIVKAYGGVFDVVDGRLCINVPPRPEGPNHVEVLDGLVDLVVVALGTAHIMGYPFQTAWNLVQRANMSKVRAAKDGSDSKRGTGYDIVKPEGWTAPDEAIAELLYHAGWGIPGYPKPDTEENDE